MTDILETLDELDDENFDNEDTESTTDVEETREDGVFSKSKAREVTEAIKYVAVATHALLYEAFTYKAHKALGYDTWAEYVSTEFDMSKSRSYQLINQAETIKLIEEHTPEGTNVKLTEAQVRDLKSELPRITEVIGKETSEMSPEEAEDFINDLITQERDQVKEDQAALERKKKEAAEAGDEGYQNALNDVANQMLGGDGELPPEEDNSVNTKRHFEADGINDFSDEADSGFFEAEVDGNGQTISSEDALNLYNFFSMLSNITGLPEPDDFIELISEDRKEEVDNQVIEASAWINRFSTLWEAKHH